MIWAARDPLRFAREVSALAALAAAEPRLTIGDMRRGEGGQLVVDVTVAMNGREFPALLAYPQSFPAVPPAVRPTDGALWSFHQYGAGGELCLEWGPDNWMPHVTGADMVASAVRLLDAEGGDPLGPVGEVATRHATTAGQDARHANLRLVCTAALEAELSARDGSAEATFSVRYGRPTWRALPKRLVRADGSGEWADPSIPLAVIDAGTSINGRILLGLDQLPRVSGTASEMRARLLGNGPGPDAADEIVMLVAKDGAMSAAYLYHASDVAFPMTVVRAAQPDGRLGPGHAALSRLRVAIVGCGSLGSKIAISLARSGVGRFLLVDDDVMLPENVVRNELDWSDVGLHKADALEARIRLAASAADVEVVARRHRLGGQEANGSLDSAVAAIAASDLIVDATADTRAFNYVSAAAADGVPLVWGEVFGGGFGGLVARSRPGLDPTPHLARARIEGWCRDRAMPAPPTTGRYGGGDRPMVADDSAVTLVAGALSAMAIDLLAGAEPSRFPHSAYMLGLSREWIFDRPFDNWPIDLGAPDPDPAPVGEDSPERLDALRQLVAVLKREGKA